MTRHRLFQSLTNIGMLSLVALHLLTPITAKASTITLVVPNAQTSTTGNGTVGLNNPATFKFQEDFGRGQFSSVGGSLLITQIAFRAAPGTGPVDVTVGSFNVYLSTSPYAPNSAGGNTLITSTYATNLGADNTLVLSGGAGTFFSSPGCAPPGPCPFDLIFNLTTPFLYNPQQGSLLMYVQFTGWNGISGELDAEGYNLPGGGVAIVDSSQKVDLAGPVVQFTGTPVPEPSSLLLLGSGALGLVGAIRRKLLR